MLPTYASEAKFLDEEEKVAAIMRLLKDSSTEVNSQFSFKEWIAPASEWETWVWGLYCLVGCTTLVISCYAVD